MSVPASSAPQAVSEEVEPDAPEGELVERVRGLPSWVSGIIGSIILVVIWEIVAVTAFNKVGSGVPTPTSVATQLWSDLTSGLYNVNFNQTMKEAATGFIDGNVLAIVLGIAFVQLPLIEKALLRIAVATYCLPIIAIGPILTFVLHGDAPQSALAGIVVFFPTLVGVCVGLRSADRSALDLIRAYGGSSWAQLFRVRLRAALPSTFAALQIAAPSAILGAIVGEYLGGVSTGLGQMMIVSGQDLNIPRTWGIAFVCTAVAGILYGLIGLIGRLVSPWAPRAGMSE